MWMQKTVSKISQFVLSYFYIVSINKQNLHHEYIKHLKKNGKKDKCQATSEPIFAQGLRGPVGEDR